MNGPYLIIPIGILLVLLYLISWFLVRMNFISGVTHRKIWNTALLLTFLVAGILGILLAVQVNYKLEWPIVKQLMKWHVDVGIAMCFTGIVHLFWHLSYYKKLFKTTGDPISGEDSGLQNVVQNDTHLAWLILLSGFLATVVQVLFIRETTTVFQGNELMMSWTLGVWMLLTGLGAFAGRSEKLAGTDGGRLVKLLTILAVLPVLLIPVVGVLKSVLFPPGIMVNPAWFILLAAIFLAPVCLLSGYLFSFLVRASCNAGTGFTKVYAYEALGSLAGGLVVSFVFVRWLSVFQSLMVLLLATLLVFVFLLKKARFVVAAALVFFLLLISGIFHVDNRLKAFLFPHQVVLESKETFHGNITITEQAGQFNFYGNGSLLYASDNTIACEEFTHFAMMQHSYPQHVWLVSGGVGGMVAEILKYRSVESVDYIEPDPHLIKLAAKYRPLPADKRVNLIFGDGRRAIQQSAKKYDVAIFAVPDPSSLLVNRFYTDEFLGILKEKLSLGAVALYGISPSGNYMSAEKTAIAGSVFHTLKNNFRNAIILPGERDYYLASDSALRLDIAQLSATKAIDTKYVNAWYIDDVSIQQRSSAILEKIQDKTLNRDEKPLPVYYHTLQFVSGFTSKSWLLIAVPLVVLLFPFFFLRPVAAGMYVAGFTASAFEILIIFTFQTYFGSVYSAIGLIIAIFMGGLAVGSLAGNKFEARKKYYVLSQLLLAFYALFFLVFWSLQKQTSSLFVGFLSFGTITFLVAAIVGFQYVMGAKLIPGNFTRTAPILYTVDLIGAALGVIAVTVVLLPLLGIRHSCQFIAGLNFLIAVLIWRRK